MSDQRDKAIRFTFAVDQQSLGVAKNAIKQLTAEVKSLVDTMGRAGGLSGAGVLGGISNKTPGAGGFSAARETALKVGSPLTAGVASDARAMAGLAKASNDALSQMTRSLKSNFSGQVSEIERLKREIGSLESQYERLGRVAESVRDRGGSMGRVNSAMVGNEVSRSSLQAQMEGHIAARDAGMADSQVGAQQPANTGMVRGFVNSFRGKDGGFDVMGLMRSGMAMAAPAAALKVLIDQSNRSEVTNAQYQVAVGMRQFGVMSRIGGSVGGLGMSIRGGDLASSMIFMNEASKGTFGGRLALDAQRARLMQDQAGQSATVGQTASRAGDAMGRGFSKYVVGLNDYLAGGLDKISPTLGNLGRSRNGHVDDLRAINALTRENLEAEQPAVKAEEMADIVAKLRASNPKWATLTNQTYGEGMSRISLARMGGLGLGVDPRTGRTRLSEFEARALASGYDPGAVAGARASLGSEAGRGLMGAGQYMLGLQLGGLGNAGSLYGTGAQFGSGGGSIAANAFMKAVQSGIGRGGVDVTAGSQLAGLVASGMTGGNFSGSNGFGAMQAMMAAGFTGTTGGDMRMARVLGAGMGEYGRNLSGQTDPLQQGINVLAATHSGASGWYARKALMGMDPTQMVDALRSGKLPGYLADQGLTMGNLQNYNNFRNQYAFSRYIAEEGGNSAVAQAVSGVRGAGGLGNYMHSQGMTARSKGGRHLIQMLATARMATEGGSLEANEGALYAEIMSDKSLLPSNRGRGAGTTSIKGTVEGAVAQELARQKREEGAFQAQTDILIKGIKGMAASEHELAGLTDALGKDATKFDAAVNAMTNALMEALHRIDPQGWAKIVKQQQEADREMAKAKAKAVAPKQGHSDPTSRHDF